MACNQTYACLAMASLGFSMLSGGVFSHSVLQSRLALSCLCQGIAAWAGGHMASCGWAWDSLCCSGASSSTSRAPLSAWACNFCRHNPINACHGRLRSNLGEKQHEILGEMHAAFAEIAVSECHRVFRRMHAPSCRNGATPVQMPWLQVLRAVLGRCGARHILHLAAVGHFGLLLLPGKPTGISSLLYLSNAGSCNENILCMHVNESQLSRKPRLMPLGCKGTGPLAYWRSCILVLYDMQTWHIQAVPVLYICEMGW